MVVWAEDASAIPGVRILGSRESLVSGESMDSAESTGPSPEFIKRATELAAEANSTTEFLNTLLSLDGALVRASTITVLRLNDGSTVLRPVAAAGWGIDAYSPQILSVTGELRSCLDKGYGLVIGGAEDLRASGLHEALYTLAPYVVVVPLRIRGSTWGVVALTCPDKREETTPDHAVYQIIANLVAVVVERELTRHALQEAERNNRLAALGQLASSISHELRNLLGAIDVTAAAASSAVIAATNSTDSEPPTLDLIRLGRLLDRIRADLSSGHRVIDDILDFGKGAQLNLMPTRLGAWAKTQQPFFQSVIGNSANIAMSTKTDAEVFVDRYRLRQALANLIKNAADASNQGDDIMIEVDVGQDPSNSENSGAVLTVTDHGSGIPASIAPNIFSPFVTTKAEGTGLGLVQAQTIITRHGGQIVIESVPGERTTVTVWLPLVPPPSFA
jgi:signal transduction histidine kinase